MLNKTLFNEKTSKILFAFLYICLFAPFVYSVYYSMPATDDFAWAIEWFSSNRIVEAFDRVGWNYMNWFGQSGVFAVLIQILFNPLYWFNDAGHSFGICMIIVFLAIAIGMIFAVRKLAGCFLQIENTFIKSAFTFCVITLIFTTYYYADVYNWWTGVPGYSFMLMLMFFCYSHIVKYVQTQDKRSYIVSIIEGVIVCTGLMNCVPMGLFFLYVVFIRKNDNPDGFWKKALPLICYVISGVFTVIAPGNYKRVDSHNKGEMNLIKGAYITLYTLGKRMVETLIKYPWTLGLFIAIILISLTIKAKDNPKFMNVIVGFVLTFIAAFGALFPYVAGERKKLGEEITPRALIAADYVMFIGMAFVAFQLGQVVAYKFNKTLQLKVSISLAAAVLVVALGAAKLMGTLMYIVPYDIIRQREQIKTIYYTWEGIIEEIEQSPEQDVEVKRENVPWTRFSYPVGIDEGTNFVPEWARGYYGGTNQCAAMWYGKNSVRVYIY